LPVEVLLETEHALVFKDINPAAPVHYLAIPKKHISTLNDLLPEDAELLGNVCLAAVEAAGLLGISEPGYRLVVNTNRDGAQTVFHIHVHLLGGRTLRWPPG